MPGTRRTRAACAALALTSGFADRAAANTPEDLFGMSARTNAMAGAGVAVASDGFAAYHNPAGLARCSDTQISVDARRVGYALDTTRIGADAPGERMRPLAGSTRTGVAGCITLPRGFAVGVAFSTTLERPITLNLETASREPNFALYGDNAEFMTILAGAAYRPREEIAIGAGASVLVRTEMPLSSYVPVGQSDEFGNFINLDLDITATIRPRAAPYLGVTVQPIPSLRLSATFRGELSHPVELPLSILAVFLGYQARIPMLLTMDTWYSPRSVSVGAAFDANDSITLAAELDWYDYSALANSSFPYLHVGDIDDRGSLFDLVGRPNPDPPDFRSVWAMRLGAEARLLDGRLAVRGGYSVRTSALPKPGGRNTTLLDGTTHSLTAGLGLAFGRGWDAAHDDDEPEVPVYEGDERRARLAYRLDGYGRVSIIPTERDPVADVEYGGAFYDFGTTFSLGWR